VVIGAVSILIAQTAPLQFAAPAAGFTYFLIGPAQWYRSVWIDKRRGEFLARAAR
jgi:hypothetical protein